jgi:hypothetical protein
MGYRCCGLDGDRLGAGLSSDLGHTRDDRTEQARIDCAGGCVSGSRQLWPATPTNRAPGTPPGARAACLPRGFPNTQYRWASTNAPSSVSFIVCVAGQDARKPGPARPRLPACNAIKATRSITRPDHRSTPPCRTIFAQASATSHVALRGRAVALPARCREPEATVSDTRLGDKAIADDARRRALAQPWRSGHYWRPAISCEERYAHR